MYACMHAHTHACICVCVCIHTHHCQKRPFLHPHHFHRFSKPQGGTLHLCQQVPPYPCLEASCVHLQPPRPTLRSCQNHPRHDIHATSKSTGPWSETTPGPGSSPELASSSSRWVLQPQGGGKHLEKHRRRPVNTQQMMQEQMTRGRAWVVFIPSPLGRWLQIVEWEQLPEPPPSPLPRPHSAAHS